MKRIQLPKIYDCLINETNEVLIDKSIIDKARLPIERMIKVGRQSSLAKWKVYTLLMLLVLGLEFPD
jgi:quinolinate synthase